MAYQFCKEYPVTLDCEGCQTVDDNGYCTIFRSPHRAHMMRARDGECYGCPAYRDTIERCERDEAERREYVLAASPNGHDRPLIVATRQEVAA